MENIEKNKFVYLKSLDDVALLELYTDFIQMHHYDPCGDTQLWMEERNIPVDKEEVYLEIRERMDICIIEKISL